MVSPSTPKPRSVRMRRISSAAMSVPSRALIFSGRRANWVGWGTKLRISMVPSTTSPAPSSSTNSQARLTAGRVLRISSPFSNLAEASVRIPRARAVRRMEVPLKLADSKTTSTVSSTISLFSPPMMPARPTARVSSAMTSMEEFRFRTLPSRVVRDSPSLARRTMILPPFT